MSASVDTSELDAWTAVLLRSRALIAAEAVKVVTKGSLNIKNDARRMAPGGTHAPYYPASISYDVKVTPAYVEGEIGPERGRRQWGLGNLLEYGSRNNPPHPHHEPAADMEEPRFYAAATAAIERVLS